MFKKLLLLALIVVGAFVATCAFAEDWQENKWQNKWKSSDGGSCYYNQWQQKWVCN